jgi:hypothetical protein
MSRSEPGRVSCDASVSLVLCFGAVGLVGGWLTADAFALDGDAIRWLLTSVTPIAAALLGAYLSARLVSAEGTQGAGPWLQRSALARGLLVVAAIVLAGAVNGASIGLLLVPPAGLVFGAFFGVLCSLPFVPALGLVLFAAMRAGRARAGSVVAASDRRAVWAAAAAVIALGVLGMRALYPPPVEPWLTTVVAGVACAVLVGLFAVDAIELARVATMAALSEVEADGGRAMRADGGEVEAVDLGVGDEVRVEVVRPKHAYRGVEQIARVVRGSRELTAAALRGGLARAGVALAVGAVLWAQPWG